MDPAIVVAAIGAIAELIIPGVIIWLLFGSGSNGNIQKVEQFGTALVTPPINTAINGYIKVAIVFIVLGGAVYVAESKYAKHEGQVLPAPPVQALGPPAPPTFGAAGGVGFQRGGVGFSQGVGLGQSAPILQPSEGGAGRPTAGERLQSAAAASSGRRAEARSAQAAERRQAATDRRTQEAHDLSMREREAKLAASGAGAGFTTGRPRHRRWR